MPIRFRCAYCNQLMGISRRKAGTVVRCPTCAGQVVVPDPDAVEATGGGGKEGPNLFERSDFDDVLRPGAPGATAAVGEGPAPPKKPAGAWGTSGEPMIDMERVDAVAVAAPVPPGSAVPEVSGTPPGLVLSSGKLTLLAVAAVLLLALAFVGGVLVGKYVL